MEKEVSLSKKELNKLIAENDGNIPIGSEEKKAIEILRKIRSKQHRIDDQYIILSKIEARVELLSYKSEQYTLSSMFRSLNFHSKQSVPNYNMDELADEWDEIDEETSIFKQENEDFHDNIAVSDRHLYDVDTLKDELLNYCNTQQLHHRFVDRIVSIVRVASILFYSTDKYTRAIMLLLFVVSTLAQKHHLFQLPKQ